MGNMKWIVAGIMALSSFGAGAQQQNNSSGSAQDSTKVAAAGAASQSDGQTANAPAVIQTTTSGSGSPAVLSGDNGAHRDGTNNVQRATMNMAGSPVTTLGMDAVTPEDPNSEARDRQRYTQAKQISRENTDKTNRSTGSTDRTVSEQKGTREGNVVREGDDRADRKSRKSERRSARKRKN